MPRLQLARVLLVAALLAPSALAAVDLQEARVPARTLAERPFPVTVRLHNDGPAMNAYLFAALYRWEEGKSPCGPMTDPHFLQATPLVQGVVPLSEGETRVWPDEGEAWEHRYARGKVDQDDARNELCVFVARAPQGREIQYEDYVSVPLTTRGVNSPPRGDWTMRPGTPRAAEDATFEAEGEDDDGDALAFSWDFGHFNASGRARAEGARVTHFFYPDADYTVTMTVSDGFDATPVARAVHVAPADAAAAEPPPLSGDEPLVEQPIPFPAALTLLAPLLVAWWRRRAPRA